LAAADQRRAEPKVPLLPPISVLMPAKPGQSVPNPVITLALALALPVPSIAAAPNKVRCSTLPTE
jgi:hypothetical protein